MAEKDSLKWTLSDDDGLTADVASAVVRTITRADLDIVFQPIVALATGRTFAYEALTRCKVVDLRDPVRLFERAVEERATGRLGRAIREATFELAPPTPLFVNVHPSELSARWIVRPDDPLGFHAARVYVEVTESAALDYYEVCMQVLRELRGRLDVELAVDDLGAGHSNLMRIVDLEPSVVKLDRSVVTDIHRSSRQQVVVRHLVRMAEELDATIVAEGIETLDELRALRDAGVHYGQGYLLARPAFPAPEVDWPL